MEAGDTAVIKTGAISFPGAQQAQDHRIIESSSLENTFKTISSKCLGSVKYISLWLCRCTYWSLHASSQQNVWLFDGAPPTQGLNGAAVTVTPLPPSNFLSATLLYPQLSPLDMLWSVTAASPDELHGFQNGFALFLTQGAEKSLQSLLKHFEVYIEGC